MPKPDPVKEVISLFDAIRKHLNYCKKQLFYRRNKIQGYDPQCAHELSKVIVELTRAIESFKMGVSSWEIDFPSLSGLSTMLSKMDHQSNDGVALEREVKAIRCGISALIKEIQIKFPETTTEAQQQGPIAEAVSEQLNTLFSVPQKGMARRPVNPVNQGALIGGAVASAIIGCLCLSLALALWPVTVACGGIVLLCAGAAIWGHYRESEPLRKQIKAVEALSQQETSAQMGTHPVCIVVGRQSSRTPCAHRLERQS